uniref:VP6 n=1 Tax=Bluetongue virus 1 (isolate South Africa) TaxID=10905 RepID=UPI0031384A87
MSAAMLLAPGDVIKRSSEELKQRQIQINLIDWTEGESEKESKAEAKEGDKAEELKDGEGTQSERDLRRKEKSGAHAKAAERGRRKQGKKPHGDAQREGTEEEKTSEEPASVGITIEGVMSQKKLLSMIGGVERKMAPIGARESAVMLVSNSIKDVVRATAYFTAPTGDPHWKEVAREASKKKNILAYTSTGGDVKTEFLHLIDHL